MDRPPTLIALPPGRPGLVFPMRMARPWEVEGPHRNLCRLEAVDALRRRRPAASLADLAREAGFAGYNQFYRAHRRLRGLPPSEA